MRQSEFGIFGIELKRVTGLTLRRESDALIIIAPFGVRPETVIALQLFPADHRDVRGEMPLVIELQDIGITLRFTFELKFRVAIPERRKRVRVSVQGARESVNDLLRRMGVALERCPVELPAFFGRSCHR